MVKSSAPSPVLHKWVTHPLLCFRTGELHQGLEFRTWSLDLRPELAPDSLDWLWQLMLVRLRSMLVLAQAGQWDLFSKFHLRPATRNMLKNMCWRPCPGKEPRQTNGTWQVVLPLLTNGIRIAFCRPLCRPMTNAAEVKPEPRTCWHQRVTMSLRMVRGNVLCLKPWNWNSSGASDTSRLADSHLNCNQYLYRINHNNLFRRNPYI